MIDRCERCGTTRREVDWSDAAGAWVCLRCHVAADTSPPVPVQDFERVVNGKIVRAPVRRPPRVVSPMEEFRERILSALDRIDPGRFGYIDRDRCTHVCPACKSDLPHYLALEFAGVAERVAFSCSRGCTRTLIAAALDRLDPARIAAGERQQTLAELAERIRQHRERQQ